MSRGFVKESDQEEMPIVPPRAALPQGTINYVTPNGKALLIAEKILLEKEKIKLPTIDEAQYRRELTIINQKLIQIQERIDSARIVEPDNTMNEIRFGAIVTFCISANKVTNTFQIVGVDEANIKKKKVAFVAPIAKALMGHKVGAIVSFQLGTEIRKMEILSISYS